MKSRRNYGQFCGLAAGLGIIGERWTLLIVRELMISPQRFNGLADNLPGIGPNLLAERLRALVEAGVVEHRPVAEDGRGKSYRLTEVGEGLRPAVLAIAKWGMGFLRESDAKDVVRAEWGFLALQSMIDRDRIPDVDETYEFRVDDDSFAIEVRGGAVSFVHASAAEPDLTITCAADTFVKIGARLLTPFDAIVTGELKVDGDADVVHRCTRMLGLA
ncbi:crotonobetainyl-CoA:carnitine CoA-transferase [Saccharothrix sp. NRRL B-16348]|uniref:winged helix-turn-helix transcriptional regulator n=1 Tax=Saccharothrix sp. NRRL B-16348 TaxID=1415542 RepID=UPI0006AEA5FE|nr:winged helix-turn-helix transcriptional regulator [Saccharothrix sp. NRRL B-16348]KOX21759.1 crotonobetainyl-CoA:carnitine CoA-transferase [Saccharothrix sp. NRRL B-16348]